MLKLETPEYLVEFDPIRRRIHVILRGHWDLAIANRYDRAFREAIRSMPEGGCPLGEQLVYIDAREFSVQTQDVLSILGALSSDPATMAKRTAIVASSALLAMQARRTVPHYYLFSDSQVAKDWLNAGSDSAI